MAFTERCLAGVECLHRAQIIHRDLKLSNVLLAPGWLPKIADLGVARLMDATSLTR